MALLFVAPRGPHGGVPPCWEGSLGAAATFVQTENRPFVCLVPPLLLNQNFSVPTSFSLFHTGLAVAL